MGSDTINYTMEHYDIADMFGKRRKPVLSLHHTIVGRAYDVKVELSIANTGRGTAIAPSLEFRLRGPWMIYQGGRDGSRREGLPLLRSRDDRLFDYAGDTSVAIHPSMRHYVTTLWLGAQYLHAGPLPDVMDYRLACVDTPAMGGILQLNPTQLGFSRDVNGYEWVDGKQLPKASQ